MDRMNGAAAYRLQPQGGDRMVETAAYLVHGPVRNVAMLQRPAPETPLRTDGIATHPTH